MQVSRKPVRTQQTHRRAGLAPLEYVLNLPIMLFLMALMMVMGTAGAWKVRTQANSRQAAFRSLTPRTGANDRNPRNWPRSATMGYGGGTAPGISTDPYLSHTVVRGPILATDDGAFLPVRDRTLDITQGVRHGQAEIRRPYPIFSKLPPGEFHFRRANPIFDGTRWQFFSMGIASNITRRILFLYPMDLEARIGQAVQDYGNAALAIYEDPDDELLPLFGADPEVRELVGERSPDFRPNVGLGSQRARTSPLRGRRLRPSVCENDPAEVRREQVEQLLQRIGGSRQRRRQSLPERVANYYIGVYQARLSEMRDPEAQPRPSPITEGELESRIKEMQKFIKLAEGRRR